MVWNDTFKGTLRFPFKSYCMLWLGTIGDWGLGGSAVFDKALSPWRLATKDQQHLSHPVTSSYAPWCHPSTSTPKPSPQHATQTSRFRRRLKLKGQRLGWSRYIILTPPALTSTHATNTHPDPTPSKWLTAAVSLLFFCNVKWNLTRGLFVACLDAEAEASL